MKKLFISFLLFFVFFPIFSVDVDSVEFYIALDKRGTNKLFLFSTGAEDPESQIMSSIRFPLVGQISGASTITCETGFSIYYELYSSSHAQGTYTLSLEFCSSQNSNDGEAYMLGYVGGSSSPDTSTSRDAGLNFEYSWTIKEENDGSLLSLSESRQTQSVYSKLPRSERAITILTGTLDYSKARKGTVDVDLSINAEYEEDGSKLLIGTYRGYAILTLSSV